MREMGILSSSHPIHNNLFCKYQRFVCGEFSAKQNKNGFLLSHGKYLLFVADYLIMAFLFCVFQFSVANQNDITLSS